MLKRDNGHSSKKRGLGRGLNALFEDEEGVYPQVETESQGGPAAPGTIRRSVGIDQLEAGLWQPRHYFQPQMLAELTESIRNHGILQPLVVRPKPGAEGRFQIIAGERRWRAAQMAQLHEVPVVVKVLEDGEAAEIALIENLQRADLNAMEEAQGYMRLMEEYKYTQEKMAQRLGKSRSHVANMVRLLGLPLAVRDMVRDGKLTAGHARALVTAENAEMLARDIIAKGLSVREAERLAAAGRPAGNGKATNKRKLPGKDVDTVALEKEMSDMLGLRVTIDVKSDGKGGRWGNLKVDFKNLDQLDDVLRRLSQESRRDVIGG